MTTIKLKLQPSIVRDKSKKVYYRMPGQYEIQQITTDIRLFQKERNEKKSQFCSVNPSYSKLQNHINNGMAILKLITKKLGNKRLCYSVSDVPNQFKFYNNHIYILSYIRTQIEQLKNINKIGTAYNYKRALSSFTSFLNGIDIPFTTINELLIGNYNAYLLKRGIVRNSISFYMRILRAVYNKAVRQHLVEQTYPFKYVYTGIDKTRKRAVGEQVIVHLYKLKLPENSHLALTRDIFLFSYFTRGMAFVDIAYLKKTDIQNEMICYIRRKTGQKLLIKIEPEINHIIEKYKHFEIPYVFPIIESKIPQEAYRQYKLGINNYNRRLKSLSKMLPDNVKLTSYVARHSWATSARNHNIPISVISAGLGHSSEQTTQIYLTMLDNSVIDDANHKIISAIEK